MSKLFILHWNDAYRVGPQKLSPKSAESIDVTQFGALLDDLRDKWPELPNGKRDGLVLFSGDVFSPSVESSVTRGSHMVPVMNELAPDVSLTGNHDFDFGYPHLSKLVQDSSFPWVLSNIIDLDTSRTPEHLHEFQVFKRSGICIGIIGLVEKEWIGTVASWPANFVYRDMAEVGIELSKRLRDPQGEYKCDLVIALTHSRVPNDITLAKDLLALSPAGQKETNIAAAHGVDLILGGHDHLYYVSKGVDSWEDFDVTEEVLGAEDDHGDILVVKSGTDFRDLSELILELDSTPKGSVRNRIIRRITGKRHTTNPAYRSSESLKNLLGTLLSSVSSSMKAPVCRTTTMLDIRSQHIRTTESAAGNWFADIVRNAYDDALSIKGCGGSDGVFICAGTLRGDSAYGPGVVRLGDILEILPFEDPIVVLELDGASIWNALESSLEMWPAQEGRFPVISGFRVSWDSRRDPGKRVLGVWLLNEKEPSDNGDDGASGLLIPGVIDEEPILPEKGDWTYTIVTRDYMAEGHDGFAALSGHKYLIDHEGGTLMSTIVRKYLLGSKFINKMSHMANGSSSADLHLRTKQAILREVTRREGEQTRVAHQTNARRWKRAAGLALQWSRPKAHYQDQLNTCATEHMSSVDSFDGVNVRKGKQSQVVPEEVDGDLLTVSPEIDGRLKDKGRD